jgi:hypothetical protein
MKHILLDLFKIRGPETSKNFTRKTEERPFDNDASFRFLCEKNNASLFALGSDTKKRPNNLILARMFEFSVLDMFELGLSCIQTMADFHQETFAVGSRPFLVFQGDAFENHPTYQQLKSLFMDFFCSKPLLSFMPSALRQGHAVVFTALPDGHVAFRHYRLDACGVEGRSAPGVQLTEIGPRFIHMKRFVVYCASFCHHRVCVVTDVVRFNMKIGRTVSGELFPGLQCVGLVLAGQTFVFDEHWSSPARLPHSKNTFIRGTLPRVHEQNVFMRSPPSPITRLFLFIEIALMAGANIQESSRVAYDALTLGWAVKVPGAHVLFTYLFLFISRLYPLYNYTMSSLLQPHYSAIRISQILPSAVHNSLLSFSSRRRHA